MSKSNRTLHLFTSEYPYGLKNEPFLETEIHYLAHAFTKVIIYPNKSSEIIRSLPANVKVNVCRINATKTGWSKFLILWKYLFLTCVIISSEVKDKGFVRVAKNMKAFLDYLAIQLLDYNAFKDKTKDVNDVFYDYWFSNATLMLAISKRKGYINTFVSRGHGFDIYDERWGSSGVPFRYWKMKHIDTLFVISRFGINYLKDKLNAVHFAKLELSFLGVEQVTLSEQHLKNNLKVIVSCSSVVERKQVLKTVDVLKTATQKIHWVHFGDGPQMDLLVEKAKQLPDCVSVDLRGHVDNKTVIEFYRNNHVDLFLSLSASEGIPVSMMEAISFGIPIAAYPVGGVPEIVVPDVTGQLFSADEANEMKLIKKLLETPLERDKTLAFYVANFSAQKNYTDFISRLC